MRPPESPTNAELTILDVLWRSGPSSVREIATAIHGEPSAVQYRTVQVLIQRLEKKDLVVGDRDVSPHRFAAAIGRGELIGDELQRVADKVCEGSLAPLLLNLARTAKLSDHDRAELWKLLEGE